MADSTTIKLEQKLGEHPLGQGAERYAWIAAEDRKQLCVSKTEAGFVAHFTRLCRVAHTGELIPL